MTAKEYLMQIQIIDERIRRKTVKLEELKRLAYGLNGGGVAGERVQESKKAHAGFESMVDSIAEMEDGIRGEVEKSLELKNIIEEQIERLGNNRYSNMLHRRYIECRKLSDIADELGYSYDWARHVHGEALKRFEKSTKFRKFDT